MISRGGKKMTSTPKRWLKLLEVSHSEIPEVA
jgi:hypothetical protein